MVKRYELSFFASRFGHPELGYVPRGKNLSEEDSLFQQHLESKGYESVLVFDGLAILEETPALSKIE